MQYEKIKIWSLSQVPGMELLKCLSGMIHILYANAATLKGPARSFQDGGWSPERLSHDQGVGTFSPNP